MTRYNADLDAITGLRIALETFAAQQADVLVVAESEISATVTALDRAEERWRNAIEQCHQELRNWQSLQLAMELGGLGSDCSAEAAALRAAEEKLSEILRLQMYLQAVLGVYRAAGERFSSVLENELPQARAYLNNRITALEAYAATRVLPASDAPAPADVQTNPRSKAGRKG